VDISWLSFVFFSICALIIATYRLHLLLQLLFPIIKNKAGQLSDVNNFRAIAKLWESITYKRIATIDVYT